jgi:acetate kinase
MFMSTLPVLVLNSGSSSIKFSVYEAVENPPRKLLEGAVEEIGTPGAKDEGKFWIKSWLNGDEGSRIVDENRAVDDLNAAFELISNALGKPPFPPPSAIGHRMVNGGPTVIEHQRLTPAVIEEMERYTAFAPLHAPSAIYIMREAVRLFPEVPNFVCLDSRFHRDIPEVTRNLPIPDHYRAMGLRRFGAHGLSYEWIVASLQPHVPARLIAAHLGNGASICAIRDGNSVDTSMGLTPTGGLISGTRTGDIDPGVMIFILRKIAENAKSIDEAADELETVVNRKSGLAGVSQMTSDMRKLREAVGNGNSEARLAVDEFIYVLRKYIGSYVAVLGGLDMLVFTGGIGEHDAATRAEVCAGMETLGIVLDPERNQSARGEAIISADTSTVVVKVISASEDLTIVHHVSRLLDW